MPNPLATAQARRVAFTYFLKLLRDELNSRNRKPVTCFISYAWEASDRDTKALQEQLRQLQGHLAILRADVKVDFLDLHGNIEKYMVENIARSDYIIFIGTPQFKTRASDPSTNVAREVREAFAKKDAIIVPLWFKGDTRRAAFPDRFQDILIHDFTNQDNYFTNMTRRDNPAGLVPLLFNLQHDREYTTFLSNLERDFKLIETNQLTLLELMQRTEQLDATNSGSAVAPQKPEEATRRQMIEGNVARGLDIAEGVEFNMSGATGEGAGINMLGLTDKEDAVFILSQGLKSVVDADKKATTFSDMKVAKNAKIDGSNASAKGANFTFSFAKTPEAVPPVKHTPPPATTAARVARPLSAADAELKAKIIAQLDIACPEVPSGDNQYRLQVLEDLAKFTAAPVAERKALRPQLEETLAELQEQ